MLTIESWKEKQAVAALAARELAAKHPHLVPVSEKNNSLVAAAKNIRIELARAFPGVKFSVKSSRFSMGDSIDVTWTDGPTTDQVNKIINKYSAGSFDGMTDSYTYSSDVWTDAFGDAKYVHSTRQYSDKMISAILARVSRQLGGLDREPTVADYRSGSIWSIKQSGGCDLSREVSVALSRHTFNATQKGRA